MFVDEINGTLKILMHGARNLHISYLKLYQRTSCKEIWLVNTLTLNCIKQKTIFILWDKILHINKLKGFRRIHLHLLLWSSYQDSAALRPFHLEVHLHHQHWRLVAAKDLPYQMTLVELGDSAHCDHVFVIPHVRSLAKHYSRHTDKFSPAFQEELYPKINIEFKWKFSNGNEKIPLTTWSSKLTQYQKDNLARQIPNE